MAKLIATYTLYHYRPARSVVQEKVGVDIKLPTSNSSLHAKNLQDLVEDFVAQGWQIDSKDTIQTISPVIANEWEPKPWNPPFGVDERDLERGKMMLYTRVASSELESFYRRYLELKKK